MGPSGGLSRCDTAFGSPACRNDENWAMGDADDSFGDAAEHEVGNSRATMRAHDDQVHSLFPRIRGDLRGGMTCSDGTDNAFWSEFSRWKLLKLFGGRCLQLKEDLLMERAELCHRVVNGRHKFHNVQQVDLRVEVPGEVTGLAHGNLTGVTEVHRDKDSGIGGHGFVPF